MMAELLKKLRLENGKTQYEVDIKEKVAIQC